MRFLLPVVLLTTSACRAPSPGVMHDGTTAVHLDTVATGFGFPWSLAFVDDTLALVADKDGALHLVTLPTGRVATIGGAPPIYRADDSGLHDVALDPAFATTRHVFLGAVEGASTANRVAIHRAELRGDRLVNDSVIYRTDPTRVGPAHPGGRLLFLPDTTLLLTLGDNYDPRDSAQALTSPLGKVIRIRRDGSIPADNPFRDRSDALPELWTIGHRNPQGLTLDPADSSVWSHEHGPRGGDELNRLVAGRNYGWPVATHGTDYDGSLISPDQSRKGIADPLHVWVPSIAPSGLAIYRGTAFPGWNGDALVGALRDRSLHRVKLREGRLVLEEVLLRDLDVRIRDVRVGPDGLVYLLTDARPGALLRLSPADG